MGPFLVKEMLFLFQGKSSGYSKSVNCYKKVEVTFSFKEYKIYFDWYLLNSSKCNIIPKWSIISGAVKLK